MAQSKRFALFFDALPAQARVAAVLNSIDRCCLLALLELRLKRLDTAFTPLEAAPELRGIADDGREQHSAARNHRSGSTNGFDMAPLLSLSV